MPSAPVDHEAAVAATSDVAILDSEVVVAAVDTTIETVTPSPEPVVEAASEPVAASPSIEWPAVSTPSEPLASTEPQAREPLFDDSLAQPRPPKLERRAHRRRPGRR